MQEPTVPDTILVQSPKCPHCGMTSVLSVSREGFERWQNDRVLIQQALPELSEDDRETLISGFHLSCWNYLFLPEDDKRAIFKNEGV